MTVRVRLLGRPRLEVDGKPPPAPPRGRKSWAVLARTVLGDRPPTRAELAAELFEAADDPLAALRWSLADLRRALGRPSVLRGDPPELAAGEVWLDVAALADGSLPDADIGAPLLEGVELRDCPAFDAWLLLARSHWAARSREELRTRVLRALATGDTPGAVRAAGRAAGLDPLDEPAQELFVRALVADGRQALATAHLSACAARFGREGLPLSPALRAAADGRVPSPPAGMRAGVAAASLLRAGRAALDAGAAAGGVETLRRAEADAARARDPALHAQVLQALGGALVHAVRGFDGEGAVVLHRALVLARRAGRHDLAADVLRELAYTDVQAGRHLSAARSLAGAAVEAAAGVEAATGEEGGAALTAGLLAVQGMNEADQGRHLAAADLLSRSAWLASSAGRGRQHSWSLGVLARSLLLSGQVGPALEAARASTAAAERARWTAFLPWPQAIGAECLAVQGRVQEARAEAESASALATELGDPCWEGMAGRLVGLLLAREGDPDAGWEWLLEARRRCDRVCDRYVWVSCYVGLAQLELAAVTDPPLARALAVGLTQEAARADLPELQAWALAHRAALGEPQALAAACQAARGVDSPALHRRLAALTREPLAVAGAGWWWLPVTGR